MRQPLRSSLVCLLLAGSASTAVAAPAYKESVVHDTTTAVEIDLNATTVLCSAADYSGTFLKVGMPELAALTLLDHQNIGANAPCVAAGACFPGNMPEDIIDPAHPTETVNINVRALRLDESDSVAQTCETYLIERVNVVIRGVEFTHERSVPLGSRPYADCVSPSPAGGDPDDEDKTDDPGTPEPQPSGGCAAASGGSSSVLVVMFGALIARRRRKTAR